MAPAREAAVMALPERPALRCDVAALSHGVGRSKGVADVLEVGRDPLQFVGVVGLQGMGIPNDQRRPRPFNDSGQLGEPVDHRSVVELDQRLQAQHFAGDLAVGSREVSSAPGEFASLR